jgi:hypothetical protein
MKTSGSAQSKHSSEDSLWIPLREAIFRVLWFATIASSVGTWMQNVGASLMTTLSPSLLIIAIVQAATSLTDSRWTSV